MAQTPAPAPEATAQSAAPASEAATPATQTPAAQTPTPAASKPETVAASPKFRPFAEVIDSEAETVSGLTKFYRQKTRLYGEIAPNQLDVDFFVIITIARGMGEEPLLGGMTWGFGDDWIWQFRKVEDSIQLVRRNVRFRASKGSPEEGAVRHAYTDSVLYNLPIETTSSSGGFVVDLTPVFMSDLPQISQVLPGFSFAADRSSWATVKGFRDNMEIEVAATYASGGTREFDTVADSRGVTINVHYSISRLPDTGYPPRLADDRVGYFLTVLKDFSRSEGLDRFVRYINRWDLRRADASAPLSPPKKTIVFWLESTIPFRYRQPIREGILEWNRAFEKVGIANAIEVRQQAPDAEWEPEDINYNTFRWITSSVGMAMGPSRVNPLTGEILDADIIFDADFIEHWKEGYEQITPKNVAHLTGGALDIPSYEKAMSERPTQLRNYLYDSRALSEGMAMQFALGSLWMAEPDKPVSTEELDKLIMQGLKATAMHEVGHTLGLRHNFKGSTVYTLAELQDPAKTSQTGLTSSIMDYLPVNISPKGEPQGDYFSTTIGVYDYWAIEYGYRPFDKPSPEAELPELQKIASRAAEPLLQYATDEDTRGIDPDPLTARFDLGKDPIEFARWRMRLIDPLWAELVARVTKDGESYKEVRGAFDTLLRHYGTAMFVVSRLVGGVYVYRDHKADPNGRPPLAVVEPQRQRDAVKLLAEHVFAENACQFPPDLYKYLVASKWSHWGAEMDNRVDYPIHDAVLAWQDRIFEQLLSSLTLSRLIDSEFTVPPDQDAYTVAELVEQLSAAVFSETDRIREGGEFTNRKPAISSLRRALQERYVERLANLALGRYPAPPDARTVAYVELEALDARLRSVLEGKAQLDRYTRAHLTETSARIRKVLESRLEVTAP